MARVCSMCNKGKMSGHNVSHAKNRTKRAWLPNIKKIKINVDGKVEKRILCTKCIKSLKEQ